jgi:hypothetical protein
MERYDNQSKVSFGQVELDQDRIGTARLDLARSDRIGG